jgi:hypothetical protein
MRGLAINQDNLTNQQGVVKSEVRVNVLNRPYGGFPWLDMPQYANTNWFNSHNFYGDLKDLDAATLEDVQKFFKTYYAPNNAAMAVTGDFDPKQAMAWIQKYFGDIPKANLPAPPDISEPRQEQEKRASKADALATRPALAFSYHAPPRDTPEYYAMGSSTRSCCKARTASSIRRSCRSAVSRAPCRAAPMPISATCSHQGPDALTFSLTATPTNRPMIIRSSTRRWRGSRRRRSRKTSSSSRSSNASHGHAGRASPASAAPTFSPALPSSTTTRQSSTVLKTSSGN